MSSLPVFLLVWSALKQGMSDPVGNLDITVGVGSEEVSDGGGLNLWELNAGTKRVLWVDHIPVPQVGMVCFIGHFFMSS